MLRLNAINDIRNSLCTWRFSRIDADFIAHFHAPVPIGPYALWVLVFMAR